MHPLSKPRVVRRAFLRRTERTKMSRHFHKHQRDHLQQLERGAINKSPAAVVNQDYLIYRIVHEERKCNVLKPQVLSSPSLLSDRQSTPHLQWLHNILFGKGNLINAKRRLVFEQQNSLLTKSMAAVAKHFSQDTIQQVLPTSLIQQTMSYKCLGCLQCVDSAQQKEATGVVRCNKCQMKPTFCNKLRNLEHQQSTSHHH